MTLQALRVHHAEMIQTQGKASRLASAFASGTLVDTSSRVHPVSKSEDLLLILFILFRRVD